MTTILFHGVEDCFGLKAYRLQGCSCNVAFLRMLGKAEDGPLGVVNPIGREQSTESSDKDTTTVVFHSRSQCVNLIGRFDEIEIVGKKVKH